MRFHTFRGFVDYKYNPSQPRDEIGRWTSGIKMWKKQSEWKGVKDGLKESCNASGLGLGKEYNTKKTLPKFVEHGNFLGNEIDRMLKGKAMTDFKKEHPIEYLRLSYTNTVPGRRCGGLYDVQNASITIATKKLLTKKSLSIGGETVGNDIASVFRHEYGHHIYANSSPSVKREWSSIASKTVRRSISSYAGSSVEEGFAEAFCAKTSSLYKKGGLPKSVDDFFAKHIKGGFK
jgi:hypothetical protein